jgi:hypothetical protein
MALWGNKDDLGNSGTVSLNYATRVVTGSGTLFGASGAGHTEAAVGDVIRFGYRDATNGGISTYFGDAVIQSIASNTSLTIASTTGLSGAAIGGTSYTISECPKFTVGDSNISQYNNDNKDTFVYGISTTGSQNAAGTQYEAGVGWVGITTYNDNSGNLRVKKEILVAMSGISTGNRPAFPDQK